MSSLYHSLLRAEPPYGKFVTKSLFFEQVFSTVKPHTIYTLKDEDIVREIQEEEGGPFKEVSFPSLYKLYMSIDDPTEWKFANECFHGWEHWELTSNSNFMKPYIERWRKELDLRTRSNALARIKSEAKSTSKEALAAAKYLIARGWEDKPSNGRGRPSKDDINRAANEIALNDKQLLEDADVVSRVLSSKVHS